MSSRHIQVSSRHPQRSDELQRSAVSAALPRTRQESDDECLELRGAAPRQLYGVGARRERAVAHREEHYADAVHVSMLVLPVGTGYQRH